MTDIEPSILRILKSQDQIVGTGFLVSSILAVTCAHVAIAAGLDGENRIRVQFPGQKQPVHATVLEKFLDLDHDIAILQLKSVPEGIQPLRLGLAEHSRAGKENTFRSFGYATAANLQGIFANGTVDGYLRQHKLIQLQSPQANKGMSGAPVWDEQRGVVIGMITKGHTELGRNEQTTFATPAELIFKACPEIQPDETCPYLGLESFSAETERFFFGRTVLTEKLLITLSRGCRFLAVFGPSGSGKSSVVQAGLLPALKKSQPSWAQITVRPTDDPFAQLNAAGLDLSNIPATKTLLFIDQFEELFTCPDDIRERFVRELAAALENSRLILIIAMRDDFYSVFNAKAAPLATSEYLKFKNVSGVLNNDQLRKIIENPADTVGLKFADGLINVIIKDATNTEAAHSSTLPLLEFALTRLWDKRRDGLLRHEGYDGITNSLASWAEEAYEELDKAEKPLAKSLLTDLVHSGDRAHDLHDKRDMRRRRALAEFDEPTRHVITHFADRRLLVTSGETVELVHDALAREWSRLQGWIDQNREQLRVIEAVSEAANTWDAASQNPDLLVHRGGRLEDALKLQKRLSIQERSYLAACKTSEQRRRRNTIAGVALAVLIVIGVLAGWAWTSNQSAIQLGYQVATANVAQANAEEQARIARAGELAALAISKKDNHYDLGLLLGLEGIHIKENARTESGLFSLVNSHPGLNRYLFGSNEVSSVAFSPDGKRLASGSYYDNTIILWDVSNSASPAKLSTLLGHTNSVRSVAFSPDGKRLASGSADNTIILWDVSNPVSPVQFSALSGHDDSVLSVAFSPDGKRLASGSDDNTIILWDVSNPTSPAKLSTLSGHTNAVTSVAFSSDGERLVSGSDDKTIILWDVSNPARPAKLSTLSGHDYAVTSVAFSLDGKRLASGSFDSTIILWDVSNPVSPVQLSTLSEHTNGVFSVAFSPDGKRLASSGSDDKTIILWDVSNPANPVQLSTLLGHTNGVLSLAFSPDGKRLASGSTDNTIILWDVSNLTSPVQFSTLSGHDDSVLSVAFSPDGKRLASSSGDKTIILWDVSSPASPVKFSTLSGHNSSVNSIAFSPDGERLVSGSDDSTIILWDVSNLARPVKLSTLLGHNSSVLSVVFSPDGKMLASGGYDSIIILWDVSNPASPAKLSTLLRHTSSVTSVAFSPDGKMLASGSFDNTIILWDVSSPASPVKLSILSGHSSFVTSVAFSPDGTMLASGNRDNTIILWNVSNPASPVKLSTLSGHSNGVSSVTFSRDGKRLASGSTDNTIILWDVSHPVSPVQLSTLSEHTNGVFSVAFSPDGKRLASSSGDKTIILWDIDPQSWIEKACQRVGRNFTRTEWAQYFPSEEYRATCPQWSLEPEPIASPTATPTP